MTTPPRHDPPRAYILPRRIRHDGEETTLQKALRRGADPRDLEVETDSGDFKPYIERKPDPRNRKPPTETP